jgi:membrane-anchored glycerophosphoryl diester phosphodiesterase (GDPDase)
MPAELAIALRRVPALAVLMILNMIVVGVGVLLLVIPGLYLLVALWMAMPLLILEGSGPIDAMKSSLRLVRGNWWRTLAMLLVMIAIYFVFIVLGIFIVAMAVQLERGADIAVVTATSTVFAISLGAFIGPLFAAVMLAVLGDLQVRRAATADVPGG